MQGTFQVAQATGTSNSTNSAPVRVYKLTKPLTDQAVIVNLGYDQKAKVDFSSIANEKITLVHIGEKLIILFDNQSTVTVEPFFDSRADGQSNITIEMAPGRDVSVQEFASLFPISTDGSVLPAADNGGNSNGNAQASGANFSPFAVDPLGPVGTNALAGQEELPGFQIQLPTGFVLTQSSTPAPTISGGLVPSLIVDESFLTAATNHGVAGSGQGPAGTTIATVQVSFNFNAPGGLQSLTYALSIATPNEDSGLIDSATGQHVLLTVNAAGVVEGRTAIGGDLVFTISVDATGHVTLTDLRAVHEGTPGNFNEGISLASGLVTLTATVTDNSGQTASASVDIGSQLTILDDGPVNNATTAAVAVAEDTLPGGNPDPGSALTTTATFSGATIASLVNGGADAPITIGFNTAINGADTGLTQTAVFGGTAFKIVWSYVSATEIDGVVSGGPNNGDKVFTLVKTAGGDFTFTLLEHVDNGTGETNTTALNLNNVFTATDADGDSVVIDNGATVTIQNDAPTQNAATVTIAVAEDTLPGGNPDKGSSLTTEASFTGAQIQGLVSAGADSPVLIGFNGAIAGANTGLTQTAVFGGTAFNIVWAVNGAHEMDGVVSGGPNNGQLVFKLVQTAGGDGIFGTADDTFTFTLLEHVDNGTGENNTTTLNLNNLFTATDTDGDSIVIDAGATVTIQNDAPTQNANTVTAAVFEDTLAAIPGHQSAGNPDGGAQPTTATFTAAQIASLVDAGADAPTLVLGFNTAINGADTGLTQTAVFGGTAFKIVWSYVSATEIDGIVDPASASPNAGDKVFTLIKTAGGDFTFTLLEHVDNGTGENNTTTLNLNNVFTATDTDGDSIVIDAGATVTIQNDAPTQNGNTVTAAVFEDTLAAIAGHQSAGNPDGGAQPTTATFTAAQIASLVDAGADAPTLVLGFNTAINGADTGLTQTAVFGGTAFKIVWSYVSATEIDGIVDPASASPNAGDKVFTLIKTAGGDFAFTLLEHVDNGTGEANTTTLNLNNVFTATDTDGDQVVIDNGATVTIQNDAPTQNANTVTAAVFEDTLAAIAGHQSAGNPDGGAQPTTATFTAAQIASLVDAGADAPTLLLGFNTAINGVDTGLTQTAVFGGTAFKIVWSYVSATEIDGIVDPASASPNAGDKVFTLIKTAGGDFTFTLLEHVDNGTGENNTTTLNLNNVFTATDTDGDQVVIDNGATVTIQNDAPTQNANTVTAAVFEDTLTAIAGHQSAGNPDGGAQPTTATFTAAQIASLVDAGADAPTLLLGFNTAINGVDTGLTQTAVFGGTAYKIVWSYVSATEIDGIVDPASASPNAGDKVFTLIKTAGGDFTFTLLEHVDNGTGENNTTTLNLNNVFTATDTDGDSIVIDAGATVTIQNDAPTQNANTVTAAVFEDTLAAIAGHQSAGNPDGGAQPTTATFTAAQIASLVDAGADAPTLVLGFNTAINGVDTGLTQTAVFGGTAFKIVWSYVSATEIDGIVDPASASPNAGDKVFTLIKTAGGDFTFTLLEHVDNGTGENNTTTLNLNNVFTATDTDGDQVVIDNGATVTIQNDAPTQNANTVTAAVFEDTLTAIAGHQSAGNPDGGAQPTTATFTAAQIASLVDAGADAPTLLLGFNTAINGVDTGLTQTAVFGGTAYKIVWSYVSATEIDGIVDPASASPNAGDKVFTLIKAAGGDFTFTLLEHVDNGTGENNTTTLNLTNVFTATDTDGDSIVIDAGATVTIQNDAPTQNANRVTAEVFEDTLAAIAGHQSAGNPDGGAQPTTATFTAAQIASLVNAGADAPTLLLGFNTAINGVDTGLTQTAVFGGTAFKIVWSYVSATEIDGIVDPASASPNAGDKVFTLIKTAGGDFTFTLLEHVDNGTGENNTTTLNLTNVFTATDTDGDSIVIDAGATVTIQNDAPTQNANTVTAAVFEDTLAAIAGHQSAGNPDGGAQPTTATFTAAQIASLVDAGADAPTLVLGFNTAINGVDTGLTQTAVFGGTAFKIVWSYVSATEIDGIVSGGPNNGDKAFTLIKTAGGDFTFTLLEHVDNGTGETNTTTLNLNNVFTATDTDGDSIVIDAGATVTIQNDAPTQNANCVTAAVFEDTLAAIAGHQSAGNPDGGAQPTTATFTAAEIASLVDAGADAPTLVLGFNTAINGVDTGLTQTAVFGGTAYKIVWSYVSATEIDGIVSGGPNNGDKAFTLVKTAGGDFTFTLLEHVDNGTGETNTTTLELNNVFTATDTDGDKVVIDNGAKVTIQNDAPTQNANTVTAAVFEDTLSAIAGHQSAGNADGGAQPTTATFTAAQIASLVNGGADAPTLLLGFNSAITGNTGLTQSEYFGGPQHNIVWSYVSATEIDGIVSGGPNNGDKVFTLVKTAGGDFTFTLLEHVDNGTGETNTATLNLNKVFTATDTDGDKVVIDNGATVTIQNDAPTQNAGTTTIAVFEDTLAAIAGHQSAGNPDGGAQPTFASFTSGQIASLVNAGADAPNLLIGFNSAITGNTGLTQSEYFGGPQHNIVWSYVSANEIDGVVSGGPNNGDKAFTLVRSAGVDGVLGTPDDVFTFTLLEHVDNGTGETNTTTLNLNNVFTATDTDGDKVVIDNGATVTIQNDAPINNSTTLAAQTVYEDGLTIANSNGQSVGNPEVGHTTVSVSYTTAQILSLVNIGADSAGIVSLAGAAQNIDNTSTGLQSKGVAVLWHVVSATEIDGVAGGRVVFTLKDNGAGTFTFTLMDQVDHLPLNVASGDNDASVTIDIAKAFVVTDSDGDKLQLDNGAMVAIENDVPTIASIQNAIMPSIVNTDAHGTWQPSVGADEPGTIGISMGTAPAGETYTVTDTGTHNAANEEIFSVKVSSGVNTYTFYEYVHFDAATHTSEMFAYASLADAQAGLGNNEFFTLAMSLDGTYDFQLVSNSLQTFQPFTFSKGLPSGNQDYATITNGVFTQQVGNDSIAGRSILIDGYTQSDTNPNHNTIFINQGGGGGLAVNQGNLDTDESVMFKFNNIVGDSARVGDQNSVTIGIGKSNGTYETFLITIKDDNGNVIAKELVKQTDGSSIIVDAAHWGVAGGALADDGNAFAAFGQIDIRNVAGEHFFFAGTNYDFTSSAYDNKVLVSSISGSSQIGTTTLTFAPTLTDYDGDTATAATNLSVTLVGTANGAGGYNLTGTDGASEVLVASSKADTLIGGIGHSDTVDYSNTTGGTGITINLAAETDTVAATVGGAAAGDVIKGIENIIGTQYVDTLTAAPGGSILDGGAGSGAGIDTLNGGVGNDILIASRTGTDILNGNGGNDTYVLQGKAGGASVSMDFGALGTDSIVVDVASQNLTISNAGLINTATQFNSGAGAPTNGGVAWQESASGDKFYYDTTNHNLWYSAAGNGSDQIQLAHISTGVPPSASAVANAIHIA